jgi:hypothetical protein
VKSNKLAQLVARLNNSGIELAVIWQNSKTRSMGGSYHVVSGPLRFSGAIDDGNP